ncbi:hypothetical protein ACK11Z_10800 [Methanoculleus bourgensis]|uniref:hypothetical protein n=1 Tax=Methanoculleus bourgensis TaxID=83986 RepID=UPI003B933D21
MREFRRATAALKRGPSVETLVVEAATWRIRDIVVQAVASAGRDPTATMKALVSCQRRIVAIVHRVILF